MGWPKGVKLSREHKEAIRQGVLRTVPIRRWKRTREQRRADILADPHSAGTRRLTPRRKPPKQQEQRKPGTVYMLGHGYVKLSDLQKIAPSVRRARPVEFV